jgi:hypothetical protein
MYGTAENQAIEPSLRKISTIQALPIDGDKGQLREISEDISRSQIVSNGE